jgi:hypothetical protein
VGGQFRSVPEFYRYFADAAVDANNAPPLRLFAQA